MPLAIPRGIVYHRVRDDVRWLLQSVACRLDDSDLVKKFETEFAGYIGRKYCFAFPYARTAIYFALKSQKLPPESEIIMPPISIKGILDVVLNLGLKPVFVDIDPDTLCFDFEKLKEAISENTKAVLVTYLFGMVPNIEQMVLHCRQKELFVIEDFSQCLNGKFNNKKIGCFGDVGIYSSSSIKTLDTFGGGLLVCDDDLLMENMSEAKASLAPPGRLGLIKKIITDLIRNVATSRLIFPVFVFPLIRLLTHSKPQSSMKHTGERNGEMIGSLPPEWFTAYTSFQAMIGLKLIKKVDETDLTRCRNVEQIKTKAPSTRFPTGVPKSINVYWQLVAYFDQPFQVQAHMHTNNVDTATTSLVQISALEAYPYQGLTPNAKTVR